VGAATGAPVELLNGDNAERPLPVGRFPKPDSRRRRLEAHLNRPVLDHDLIGAFLGLGYLIRSEGRGVQVQARAVPPEVDSDRGVTRELGEDGREKMLAGVLLHMVEATAPIDPAEDALTGQRRGKEVGDPLPFVHHVDNLDSTQLADIERLATGSGVEGSLIQVDAPGVIRPVYYRCLEGAEVCVGIVKSVGHLSRTTVQLSRIGVGGGVISSTKARR
jgi:hypothetical protein